MRRVGLIVAALLAATGAGATDYYVSRSSTRLTTPCDAGTPCRPSYVWSLDLSGSDRVLFVPGLYVGQNYMIIPTDNDDGAFVGCTDERSVVDGQVGCTLDMNGATGYPGLTTAGNTGMTIRGFNVAREGAQTSSSLSGLCKANGTTNRLERLICEDGAEHYGTMREEGTDNVWVDNYAHGSGRKIWNASNGSGSGPTFLNAMGRHEFSTTDSVRKCYTLSYNTPGRKAFDMTCISSWDLQPEPYARITYEATSCIDSGCSPIHLCAENGQARGGWRHALSLDTPVSGGLDAIVRGGIFADEAENCTDGNSPPRDVLNVGSGTTEVPGLQDVEMTNIVAYTAHANRRPISLQPTNAGTPGLSITDATGIGNTTNRIDADWTQTDVEFADEDAGPGIDGKFGTLTSSVWDGDGAHLCYVYDEAGNLTTRGRFPNPLGARIRDWYDATKCSAAVCPRGPGHAHTIIGYIPNCSGSSCTPSQVAALHTRWEPDAYLIDRFGAPPPECFRLWRGKVL